MCQGPSAGSIQSEAEHRLLWLVCRYCILLVALLSCLGTFSVDLLAGLWALPCRAACCSSSAPRPPATVGAKGRRPRRCQACGARVLKRPKILSLADRYRRGENSSGLVANFLSGDSATFMALMEPQYHTWHSRTKRFHKELSESLAVIDALQSVVPEHGAWHAIDLCCGKSLTSALLAVPNAGMAVTAVDRVQPQDLPHYADAGVANVEYLQLDVLADTFVDTLAARVEALGRPTALLGMHLCGRLSERAVEAFQRIDLVRACVLAPCCLPHSKVAPAELAHLYDTGMAHTDQFHAWVDYLAAFLSVTPGVSVTRTEVDDILSTRRTVMVAKKTPLVPEGA